MTSPNRFLTKSRFKVGHECPSKLYFLNKPEYGNTKLENSFLEALAEGGFQVGELAKLYHPGGYEIESRQSEEAISQTSEALKNDSVTLFEPAFHAENYFIRVDVIIKKGNYIELIEVKAKSFDSAGENQFYNKAKLKKGIRELHSKWEPYLIDVAFQVFVLKKAFPHFKISSFLMLADKTAVASVDGLNQKFLLTHDEKSTSRVKVESGLTKESLGDPVLIKVCVDDEIQHLFSSTFLENLSFDEYAEHLSKAYSQNKKITVLPGHHCKSCEFRIGNNLKQRGLKSGFEECWKQERHLKTEDFDRPMVFDLWNFRKSEKLINDGCLFIDQMHEEDIKPEENTTDLGLSSSERQWLQAEKTIKKDSTPYLDCVGLDSEISTWQYPLHFIDFETTMVAIPFHKGRRPYEQIAFQFSHHVISKDGRIEHRSEYLNLDRGKFPNFDFLRALKTDLSSDSGTIFRFAAHENTVLCQIMNQLKYSDEPDRDELITWIKTITKASEKSPEKWEGSRNMVDMRELVLKYFYHPSTEGSNSIKDILPAVIEASDYLKSKYEKPIYGSANGIKSTNYKDWIWIRRTPDGAIANPYTLLDPIFSDVASEELEKVIAVLDEDHRIADGGAAMTAYARMQFTQMSEAECSLAAKALLKYCELDTFAMVLIYEYWKSEIEKNLRGK